MKNANINRRIVYVDDQKDNLIVFEAQVSDNWGVKCYINASDALKDLKELNPGIILSNMKMGKINGIDFLVRGRELVPNAVRLIVTGYADEDLMIAAVRYAQVFDYIRKPYDPKDLQIRLEKAWTQYEENCKKGHAEGLMVNHNKLVLDENAKLKKLLHEKNDEIAKLKEEYAQLQNSIRGLVDKTSLKKAA